MWRIVPKAEADRGATAVLAALVMTLCLGLAAVAIDVGVLWTDKVQIQNGADAAALAIAEACAAGDCGTEETRKKIAEDLILANSSTGGATGRISSFNDCELGKPGSVTVETEQEQKHYFAPAIGINSSIVRASSTAVWSGKCDTINQLPLMLPLESWSFSTNSGNSFTKKIVRINASTGLTPGNPSDLQWVTTNTECRVNNIFAPTADTPVKVGDLLQQEHNIFRQSGNIPTGCWTGINYFNKYFSSGQPLPVMLYDGVQPLGLLKGFNVQAFATFVPTAYHLRRDFSGMAQDSPLAIENLGATGDASPYWIEGYFTSCAYGSSTVNPSNQPSSPASCATSPAVGNTVNGNVVRLEK